MTTRPHKRGTAFLHLGIFQIFPVPLRQIRWGVVSDGGTWYSSYLSHARSHQLLFF